VAEGRQRGGGVEGVVGGDGEGAAGAGGPWGGVDGWVDGLPERSTLLRNPGVGC
jgi:hypothetical protein